ncbi:FAD-binding oxidoreductase [Luteolibacter sp. GHJ8]|uniref:D-amino-acid oxidase n=1 Tax=Luteolibacter rhizosphaerae TaxID=2989719 RepID=A0ABT3G382_9BACT|nr:FAD-dependent oxidoreductase [Luteolibacter rhizosphaerae]MCW1914316.1 FAD-binding oxidoreductase [Luteolibacter rhizosphaerae]
MNRRRSLSLALGSLALATGCRRKEEVAVAPAEPTPAPPPAPVKPLEGADLVPAKIDASLEIRTITGLRPFRPSGYVVRREEREGKTLVHNYGHGGGGITLSWGCADQAMRTMESVSGLSCAVIGGGVMGLTTARMLQLRGAKVKIYTDHLPPDTTSNVAGGHWWPVSVFDSSKRTPEFAAQFVEASRFAYRYFQRLVGPRWGVRWVPSYYLSDGAPDNGWMAGPGGVLHDTQVGFKDFGPGEHVFPAQYARRFHTLLIEPSIYLETLLRDVQGAGGEIEIRRFASAEEILKVPEQTIFNCTGLGARELFKDEELIPVKGQLSFLKPQTEVNYNLLLGSYYMFSRGDGLLLGGTFDRGQWDLTTDDAVKRRVIEGQKRIFDAMAKTRHEHLAALAKQHTPI